MDRHSGRWKTIVLGFLAAWCLAGCGGQSYPDIPKGITKGPHGGMAYELPNGAGYCEMKYETTGSGKSVKTDLAVYFLKPDGKTPASPVPTDATFALENGNSIKLQPAVDPADPAGSARFVVPSGTVDEDDVRGELTATIGGAPVKVKIHFR